MPALVFGQPVAAEHDQPTIREVAEHVARLLDVETFPLVGKEPSRGHKWGTDRKRGSPGVQQASDKAWVQSTGYGIMPVQGSDLYILDCDSLPFLGQLFKDFPQLSSTPMTYSGDRVRALNGHCHLFVRLTLSASADAAVPFTGVRSRKGPGGTEVASLRGSGAYVVGPGSLHPGSHERYACSSMSEPIRLSPLDSAKLLAMFDPPCAEASPNRPRAIYRQHGVSSDVDVMAAILRQRGYQPNGAWLNGPCFHPENHQHDDEHPSFGVNIVSGVGHCFVPGCDNYSPSEVAAALSLEPSLPDLGERPFVFSGEMLNGLPELSDGSREPGVHLCVELNLASALFRRGCYQSARFHDILWTNARSRNGQVVYQTADLVALGASYGLSRDQVNKALWQMRQLGLLEKAGHGLYRRVGLARIRERLGLGEEFALVYLPHSAYTSAPSDYFQVVLLAIEHYLPKGLATATIGKAAGVSRGSVYDHERGLGVVRVTVTRRVGIAPASDPSFIKVYDVQGRYVAVLDGEDTYGACDVATRSGGKPWGWKQSPSRRVLPNLPICG